MKNKALGFVLIMFLLLCLEVMHSCSVDALYHDTRKIPSGIWKAHQPMVFEFSFQDSLKPVDVYVDIRNYDDYSYANLYLFLDTRFPDGRLFRDTLECILATPEGRWLGRKSGSLRESRFLIKRNVVLPRKGKYTFSFQQAMREEQLKGISQIGLRITPSQIQSE